MFPPTHPFSGLGGVEDLGDLQFVQDRIKAGDWWEVEGDIDAIGDTIEFVPASGKTAVIFEAKITITGTVPVVTDNSTIRNEVEADLLIDTVRKDTTNIGGATKSIGSAGNVSRNSSGLGNLGDGRFNALGKSLVGNGAKKIEIKNIVDNGTAHASMSGWLFTT